MIDKLLEIVAPHLCCGCGRGSAVLCNDCKNNIVFDKLSACLLCLMPCKANGLCNSCQPKVCYSRAWFVGERKDEIEKLINTYKFERVKSAYKSTADLLDTTLPALPADVVIVPVPTISKHIRQRGYDHTLLLARELARRRGLKLARPLRRVTATSQLGKTARQRRQQASEAFGLAGNLDSQATYLLIDDIFTTGSTIKYASEALRQSGAGDIWVAVVGRQTLD